MSELGNHDPRRCRSPPATKSGNRTTGLLSQVFSFPALLGALLVGAVFLVGRLFLVDPDLWWHIKVGQDILDPQLAHDRSLFFYGRRSSLARLRVAGRCVARSGGAPWRIARPGGLLDCAWHAVMLRSTRSRRSVPEIRRLALPSRRCSLCWLCLRFLSVRKCSDICFWSSR